MEPKKEFKKDYWQMVADEAIKQKKPEILQDAMEHIEVSDGFREMANKGRRLNPENRNYGTKH